MFKYIHRTPKSEVSYSQNGPPISNTKQRKQQKETRKKGEIFIPTIRQFSIDICLPLRQPHCGGSIVSRGIPSSASLDHRYPQPITADASSCTDLIEVWNECFCNSSGLSPRGAPARTGECSITLNSLPCNTNIWGSAAPTSLRGASSWSVRCRRR